MMSDGTQYLTQDKLDALKRELAELRGIKIPLIAKRIDEARQMGDLSENAEYHAAREEMGWTQAKAKEIDYVLANATIFAGASAKQGSVSIGSTVVVSINKANREFTIVGAQEADPLAGRISNESPLGQAFLDKKKGDQVEVRVPAGIQIYKILEIK